MLLESVASSLSLESFLDVSNIWPFNIKLQMEEEMEKMNEPRNKEIVFLLGYSIWFWAMLYFVYEKCLNSLLRRMHLPLIQRSRIIEALWICSFLFGSICYLQSSNNTTLSFANHRLQMSHQELAIVLHKSFYFHQAGLLMLNKGACVKAWTNFFFATFVLTSYHQKWCFTIGKLLYYRAIEGLIINSCRILTYSAHRAGKRIAKALFCLHCLCWTYLYVVYVPKSILSPEKIEYVKMELGLWLWFAAECLDSVWWRMCWCMRSPHWLEICIFPPPTKEAIELAMIKRRQSNASKLVRKPKTKSSEMLETLMCGLALKCRLKRLRQAKRKKNLESSLASTSRKIDLEDSDRTQDLNDSEDASEDGKLLGTLSNEATESAKADDEKCIEDECVDDELSEEMICHDSTE